jgi:hypothetical protein
MDSTSFDADPPVDCDDEYWECTDPEKAFKQPDGVPCSFTMFRLAFELVQMASFAQRAMVLRLSFLKLSLADQQPVKHAGASTRDIRPNRSMGATYGDENTICNREMEGSCARLL